MSDCIINQHMVDDWDIHMPTDTDPRLVYYLICVVVSYVRNEISSEELERWDFICDTKCEFGLSEAFDLERIIEAIQAIDLKN